MARCARPNNGLETSHTEDMLRHRGRVSRNQAQLENANAYSPVITVVFARLRTVKWQIVVVYLIKQAACSFGVRLIWRGFGPSIRGAGYHPNSSDCNTLLNKYATGL